MPVNAEYWEPGNEGGNGKSWEGNNTSDDLRCGGSQGENEVPKAPGLATAGTNCVMVLCVLARMYRPSLPLTPVLSLCLDLVNAELS